jgi:hypothetical protein
MNDLPWEDYLLERKVESDLKDLLKTLVAFANSVMPGHIATILIGEKDDGTAAGVTNPENIQNTVRKECEKIYPDIVWQSKVYKKDGKHCVRVEIEYSGNTPHFGGPAWVRRGNSTIKASDEVFQRLIELRLESVRELAKWIDKDILIEGDKGQFPPNPSSNIWVRHQRWPGESTVKLLFVNNFWITVEDKDGRHLSEPIEKVTLNYHSGKQCLKLLIKH